MAQIPASVRHRNPGAQWPGPVASRWGSTGFEVLNDGQGNKIATFPTWEQGAAAHLDLLRSNYQGMTLADAINKWSGGNSADAYMARVARETGLAPNAVISDDLLRSPEGLALVKSMAGHEKGPDGQGVPDDAWNKAFAMVYGGEAPPAASSSGGMLADVMQQDEAPNSTGGGMLADVVNEKTDATAGDSGGLLSGLLTFGKTMDNVGGKAAAAKEEEADGAAPNKRPAVRLPKVDMSRVAAVLNSRSRLGSA